MIFLGYKTSFDNYDTLDKSFAGWFFEYWWIAVIAIIVITTASVLLYYRLTRLHSISLHIGNKITVVKVQHGKTFSAPMLSSKNNQQFKGWFRDTACMIPYNSSDKVISDITLYAKFE